ncbi:hypothetical protein HPB47_027530 [Ixodes persulcatus]|uniref:Uncharacterized protein n=1 Tax=Ixodes persulcatus TaxID=34615 RepID=A0AC60PWU5_IXOPE|nr:hypothetical protein HPB47_027530 [Ixodes persulcatus]
MREFQAVLGFPNAIGALDGCHLPVSPPKDLAVDYHNYKGWYSVILLALVDHRYLFRYISVGTPGRCHDASVYQRSPLAHLLEQNQTAVPRVKNAAVRHRVEPQPGARTHGQRTLGLGFPYPERPGRRHPSGSDETLTGRASPSRSPPGRRKKKEEKKTGPAAAAGEPRLMDRRQRAASAPMRRDLARPGISESKANARLYRFTNLLRLSRRCPAVGCLPARPTAAPRLMRREPLALVHSRGARRSPASRISRGAEMCVRRCNQQGAPSSQATFESRLGVADVYPWAEKIGALSADSGGGRGDQLAPGAAALRHRPRPGAESNVARATLCASAALSGLPDGEGACEGDTAGGSDRDSQHRYAEIPSRSAGRAGSLRACRAAGMMRCSVAESRWPAPGHPDPTAPLRQLAPLIRLSPYSLLPPGERQSAERICARLG